MSKQEAALLALVKQFDVVRAEATRINKDKDTLSARIKTLIGDKEEVPLEGYSVTYRHDSDREVVKFDQDRFQKEEPKLYKKYVKTETVSGSRRLIITSLEE